MKDIYLYLGIASCGCVVYNLGQKAISPAVNPMILLMGIYLFAFVIALASVPLFKQPDQSTDLIHMVSWPVFAVGVGAVLFEIGFLLAYRSGGSIQWFSVAVTGSAAVVLIPVALIVFREHFSAVRVMGVALTVVGIGLMTIK